MISLIKKWVMKKMKKSSHTVVIADDMAFEINLKKGDIVRSVDHNVKHHRAKSCIVTGFTIKGTRIFPILTFASALDNKFHDYTVKAGSCTRLVGELEYPVGVKLCQL